MLKEYKAVAVVDFETSGLDPKQEYPIEVAVFKKYMDGENSQNNHEEVYSSLIKLPNNVELSEFITNFTGLTTEKVNTSGKELGEVQHILKELLKDDTLVVAHNASFDLGYLFHHFQIEPKGFLCTRTIEFLTNPDKSSSLEPTYSRYFGEVKQSHRALGDVFMTMELLEKHHAVHGEAINFFLNKMVITPERGLLYTPNNATVLDFDKQFIKK